MLRCPKCGTDNLLSAVFCRGCGERMNLDEIKPDDFDKLDNKKDANTIQNIIGGIIIGVLVVAFVIGLLFPMPGSLSTTEAGQTAAVEKFSGGPEFTATDQELTDFANAMKARFTGEDTDPLFKSVTVRCLGDNQVKVLIKATYFGFLPVTVSVKCTANQGDNISLMGQQVKLGLLPLPAGMEEQFFIPLRNYGRNMMNDANQKIKKLEISEGQATIRHGRVKLD